mmetsp:Transcript_30845/g.56878  ORF Transcript_30845/g.56878 Transcript_30845/m.56878 type:complete len:98 (-) Transcript_30845:529-822(-)
MYIEDLFGNITIKCYLLLILLMQHLLFSLIMMQHWLFHDQAQHSVLQLAPHQQQDFPLRLGGDYYYQSDPAAVAVDLVSNFVQFAPSQRLSFQSCMV